MADPKKDVVLALILYTPGPDGTDPAAEKKVNEFTGRYGLTHRLFGPEISSDMQGRTWMFLKGISPEMLVRQDKVTNELEVMKVEGQTLADMERTNTAVEKQRALAIKAGLINPMAGPGMAGAGQMPPMPRFPRK